MINMMKSIAKIVLCIFLTFALIVGILIFISQKCLKVTTYQLESEKVRERLRIVQLTDLHSYQFGKDNERLIKRIIAQAPDLIFMTGDMLNGYEERTDILCDLVKELGEVAPIYVSYGNHEKEYMDTFGEEDCLKDALQAAGAVVLEQEYVDIEVNGTELRIGGLYGYVLDYDFQDGTEQRFMEQFVETDRMKLLLAHIPEGLLLWKSMETWEVDLIFSGHVHGGQIRIPFIGGLYDPEEGYFPTYTKGMFTLGNSTMILSAGLGSSHGIPRVNNIPEIVVCEIE